MSAIAIDDLTKSYGHIRALTGVSFEIQKGEVIGLLGPNGAGKTTLMKILTGYLEPDGGSAKIHGVDVVQDPIGAQRRIGYLPESAPVYREMLVQEYLEMMASLRGVAAATAATAWPWYSAFSRAITLRLRSPLSISASPLATSPLGSARKSSAVTTASTPGSASAALASMPRMRACACGLRSTRPQTMPGSV